MSIRFERTDWSLFRTLPTLCQKAGVPQSELAALVLKEIADNALDAGANAECSFKDGRYVVRDDGLGIPGTAEEIASLFSIARPMASTKLVRLPTRGALGNGLRVVAGAVLATGGDIEVCRSTPEEALGLRVLLAPQDDGTTRVVESGPWETALAGTRVSVRLGSPLAGTDPNLAMAWARAAITISRGGTRYRGKTSAWWYDADSFYEMLQAAGAAPVGSLVGLFDGLDGPRKLSQAAGPLAGAACREVDRSAAEEMLGRMRAATPAPKPKRLGAVGEAVVGWKPRAYAKAEGTFRVSPSRGTTAAEIPFVAEAWAAPVDDGDPRATMIVYANRTPVTARVSFWHDGGKATFYGCNLNVEIPSSKKKAVGFRLCVTAPYLPITSDGKSPDLSFMREGVEEALVKAARGAKRMIVTPAGEVTAAPARTSIKDAVTALIPAAIRKASGDGAYRFSLRQLFYAVRTPLLADGFEEPDYGYFAQVVTDYEAAAGRDIPGMYRDARGTLYHPHTGEEIPLGTLNVERYERPAWTFRSVLYSEKEGFFSILRAAKWPERNDCALLTSKGFASRAARDVIDLLGDSGEEVTFFAIHDADGPGTAIMEALQEATRARPGRRVRIVNLGLDPGEAIDMGLAVEPVARKRGRVPVGSYLAGTEWEDWLQTKRVELNAMTSPQFIAWLDRKFAPHRTGKVVPPRPVLRETLTEAARRRARDQIVAEVLAAAGVDRMVEERMAAVAPALDRAADTLDQRVGSELRVRPAEQWRAPVERLAERLLCGD